MPTPTETVTQLENKFWQSMIDEETDVALELLNEPALMVSTHGAMKFDHAGYKKMAEQGTRVLKSFELSDVNVVFPNDATAIMTYRVKQTMSPRGKTETTTDEMMDSSTWVKAGAAWKCVMHTETPVAEAA